MREIIKQNEKFREYWKQIHNIKLELMEPDKCPVVIEELKLKIKKIKDKIDELSKI